MEALDLPPIGEFVQMIADSGGKRYARQAAVDSIITMGDVYEMAAGGEIIST